MKISLRNRKQEQQGAIMVYFIALVIVIGAIAGVAGYVSETTTLAHRRSDMLEAVQYVEGGAVLACADLSNAYTNTTGGFPANLASSFAYTLSSTLSTSQQKV